MNSHFPHFSHPLTVQDYTRAALTIGLWNSESILFERYFEPKGHLLDLGCGAGRVAFALYEKGFQHITGVDVAEAMVLQAKAIHLSKGAPPGLHFEAQNALHLPYPPEHFDGIIFSFNGLGQIPFRANRRKALLEIHRTLKKGCFFAFTAHDRESYPKFWEEERIRWREGKQHPLLIEFGNRICETPWGRYMFHVPTEKEMHFELKKAGFTPVFTALRSAIAQESEATEAFSNECRFWVAQKG
jgi:ubiquinone/menaquinone biosynthesis C-methylase UbiE